MASITSLMNGSSSASGLYGNRNVISGLATGMDTEAMIENAISGYQTKISNLQQNRTKLEWEQQALRTIINDLNVFSEKYISLTSSTSLKSTSFFNNVISMVANGENAKKVAVSGKSQSDIEILGVNQLATTARLTVSKVGDKESTGTVEGEEIDLGTKSTHSKIVGSMTIADGSRNLKVTFTEDELVQAESDANGKDANQVFVDMINSKLKEAYSSLSVSNGTVKASLSDDGKTITFSGNNETYIKSASGDLRTTLGIKTGDTSKTISLDGAQFTEEKTVAQRLAEEEITFNLDGKTAKIKLDNLPADADGQAVLEALQTKLDAAFGSGRITVDTTAADGNSFTANFTVDKTSSLTITGGEALGFSDTASNYFNVKNTLGDLVDLSQLNAVGQNAKGEDLYSFKLNGVEIGQYTAETSLEKVMQDINANQKAGVTVNFSQLTNQFVFSSTQTGSAGKVSFSDDQGSDLSRALFGSGELEAKGKDAEFAVSVNGGAAMTLTRSSNTVDLDGLQVTLKGTFGEFDAAKEFVAGSAEAVTFSTESDSDKIVDTIKAFVEDFNKMANSIKDAYSTTELKNSSGNPYEPLTEEDRADMSESEIKAYEEKAKTGLLFGDRDLSGLYDQLRSALVLNGKVAADMSAIGLSTSFSNGKTTLTLDESKLRSALESDPDKVTNVFTNSTDGLIRKLEKPIETYAKTMGATKGILVDRAGSELSPVSLMQNTLQTKMDKLNDQILKWQEKMSDKVDYYTRQFTLLEQLVNEMNSQSSALAGLMGGY